MRYIKVSVAAGKIMGLLRRRKSKVRPYCIWNGCAEIVPQLGGQMNESVFFMQYNHISLENRDFTYIKIPENAVQKNTCFKHLKF